MKIGILTFHSEVNYGSVLQAFALQTALISLGHDVIIIDKWEDKGNPRLLGILSSRSLKEWCKFLLGGMLGMGDFRILQRRIKTIQFIKKNLHCSSYHFYKWEEAPQDLGVDLIVIGSDQVWNDKIVAPPDYLLKKVPDNIMGISYAASFGLHELSSNWINEYKEGFKRLMAISCREQEAVRLVESLGYKATHVVDPTILVDPNKCWSRFSSISNQSKKTLVCYALGIDIFELVKLTNQFAKRNNAVVKIFTKEHSLLPTCVGLKNKLKTIISVFSMLIHPRVKFMFSAAPDDFVSNFSSATWVITDSFHGLMFSTIFERNVRILVPTEGQRAQMSSRLTEFAYQYVEGPIISHSLSEALTSLENKKKVSYKQDVLHKAIQQSQIWLNNAIDVCKKEM